MHKFRVRQLIPARSIGGIVGVLLFAFAISEAAGQRTGSAGGGAGKTVRVQTAPNATIWMDELKRGTTDPTGQLELKPVTSRAHVVRVRAVGFKEVTRNLAPPIPASVEIRLTLKADAAETAFQEAEAAAATAKDDAARNAAVDLYKKALAARPNYAAAHLGMARVSSELGDYDGALDQIDEARRDRPSYAEASAVEGRIKRSQQDEAGAAASFRRAIREGRGFQPEAHTGLALVYQDEGKDEDAVKEFQTAIAQLSDSEPLLYQLLGATYEKMEKYKEAVEAYDKYLALAPNGNLAPAIRSTIDQLRRQANGEQLLP